MTQPTTVQTPRNLSVTAPRTATEPSRTIRTMLDPTLGRYVALSVTVEHPLYPVTGADLAHTPVRRLIANGLRAAVLEANPDLASNAVVKTWAKGDAHSARPLAKQLREWPTNDLLRQAGLIMRLERIVGGRPVITMARCLGIGYADAKRWLPKVRHVEKNDCSCHFGMI